MKNFNAHFMRLRETWFCAKILRFSFELLQRRLFPHSLISFIEAWTFWGNFKIIILIGIL